MQALQRNLNHRKSLPCLSSMATSVHCSNLQGLHSDEWDKGHMTGDISSSETLAKPHTLFRTLERCSPYDIDFAIHNQWNAEKESAVREPFDYSSSHPGKNIRATFINTFGTWLGVPSKSIEIIACAVSLLHESSLMIDDIQDHSELRRGFPAAHCVFGTPQTINSANYIYFVALQEITKLQNPVAISIFVEELLALHRGQGMDLHWRDSLICPTEIDYLNMVGNKTGGLFRLIVKLLQAESNNCKVDCTPLASLIGMFMET
ncbi:geranylgeranyl pyrophosphate synthase [Fusarium austroafricanum]|uniref:Geranylgeranyl pyrophosphate synthase n=1 Tax=Fusarium austroafricanum TaxID=2364996 RepID=A0A8H4NWH3_9HYPO|nr:geranylgeranyl pyrophosphate synthase [Fusarium austroafricanum]